MITTHQLASTAGIAESSVVALYPYGSRVYATYRKNSDYDYIVISNDCEAQDGQQFDSADGEVSVHVYSVESWQRHLDDHKIFALECFFLRGWESQHPFTFTLDKAKLRKAISSVASNSWVKCKKKLTVESDAREVGIKSLFHSFRIPMFGIQIAKLGKIENYLEATAFWVDEIEPMLSDTSVTWDHIKETYQQRHNALMTEFRKYAEKE